MLEDTLFHCQQAVEKALKALLTWHDRPFRKTHDLVELGGQCVEVIPEIEPILRRVAILTEYAWKYRYPGDEEQPKKADVRKTLSLAKEGVQAILALLPEEVTP